MPSPTIVDLLSTDDETTVQQTRSNSKRGTIDLASHIESLSTANSLGNDHRLAEIWNESVPKRRKLSQSPPRQKIATSKRSLNSTIPALGDVLLVPEHTRRNRDFSELSDDIVFTSSARVTGGALRASKPCLDDAFSQGSDDDLPDDIFSLNASNPAPRVSDKTARFLAKIKQNDIPISRKPSSTAKLSTTKRTSGGTSAPPHATQDKISSEDEHHVVKKSRAKTTRKPKLTEDDKALKAQEREAAKEARATQKAKDKEADKERRRLEREETAREKQCAADLTEVNKARKDRKETSKEMIVDIPINIEGERVEHQIKEFMKTQGISTTSYQSPVPSTIRWRRKVDSYFDEEKGHRIAMPKAIHDEKHATCLMSAKEFVELAAADNDQLESNTLQDHIRKLKTKFAGCHVIYIIEGLDALMRKNKNARNRAYQSAVLGQVLSVEDSAPASSQQKARKKKQPDVPIDEDKVEDALLQLQVIEGCLVHHTATSFETAEWVANFTQHISQLPYRYIFRPSFIRKLGGITVTQARPNAARHIVLHGQRPGQDRRGQRRHIHQDAAGGEDDHRFNGVWYRGEIPRCQQPAQRLQAAWAFSLGGFKGTLIHWLPFLVEPLSADNCTHPEIGK